MQPLDLAATFIQKSGSNTLTSNILLEAALEIEKIVFDDNDEGPEELITGIEQGLKFSGVAVTAGIVIWISQLGGLFASVLAALPAWRTLDLIPILGDEEEDDKPEWEVDEEDADDDSLIENDDANQKIDSVQVRADR